MNTRSAGTFHHKGFTLVEIVVVVGIVAIASAIAMVNIIKPREQAQRTTCAANLRQLENAKQQWATEHSKQNTDQPTLAELTPYFRFPPICPLGGSYSINPTGTPATCPIESHTL